MNFIDIWILNQNEAVCEIKITLDSFNLKTFEDKNNFSKNLKEKIIILLKDENIQEYFIEIN